MKANYTRQPTYYVIVKDVQIINNEDKTNIGSGPIEVLTNRDKAVNHVYALNCMKEKLAKIVKDDNPEKIKECNIEFRLCELDEESNKTVSNLIAANEEDMKDERNNGNEGATNA